MNWKKYILWFAQEHINFRYPVNMQQPRVHCVRINTIDFNWFVSGAPVVIVSVRNSAQISAQPFGRGGLDCIEYKTIFFEQTILYSLTIDKEAIHRD